MTIIEATSDINIDLFANALPFARSIVTFKSKIEKGVQK